MGDEEFLNDETMDFIQLWDFAQSLSPSAQEQMFTADDIVLMDEMVVAQNFSIALDLLCHRMKSYAVNHSRRFPDEIRDLLHSKLKRDKRQKFIEVNPPPPPLEDCGAPPPTLEEFRAANFIGLPPPPAPTNNFTSPHPGPGPHNDYNHYDYHDDDQEEYYDYDEGQAVEERLKRRQLMEEQDMDYIRSLIADSEANEPSNEILSSPWPASEIGKVVYGTPEIVDLSENIAIDDGDVQVQIILPDRRLQVAVNPDTTQIKNVRRWIYNQTEEDYQEFFTNYPKREWPQEQLLSDMPIENKRLLLIAQKK